MPQRFDARWFQILFQLSFLLCGVLLFDFSVSAVQIILTFSTAIVTQMICLSLIGKNEFGYKSALITAFGLSLLLRTNHLWVHPLAACIGIASKFLLRTKHGHLFNPANIAIILAVSFLPGTWISPGQWGQDVFFVLAFFILGSTVVMKVHRSDISWVFLVSFLALFGARVFWLGQSPKVWVHHLLDGGLLLFTFFMISDPKTIPTSKTGRYVHAIATACIAFVWQFVWFRTNGLVWALFFSSMLVPLWNKLWAGETFAWTQRSPSISEAIG